MNRQPDEETHRMRNAGPCGARGLARQHAEGSGFPTPQLSEKGR